MNFNHQTLDFDTAVRPSLEVPVGEKEASAKASCLVQPGQKAGQFAQYVVLQNQSRRMVLFSSSPSAVIVAMLRNSGVRVGLVLPATMKSLPENIGLYDYMCICSQDSPVGTLSYAIKELGNMKWAIEEPLIIKITDQGQTVQFLPHR